MAKRTTLLFEDEALLRGIKEQAILEKSSMNQYILDLIKEDLRNKVGAKVIKKYSDGTTEEMEMWSMYDASNEFNDCVRRITEPSFTENGVYPTKILESVELYEKDKKVGEAPSSGPVDGH